MRIAAVQMAVPDPVATAAWYGAALGLPVSDTDVGVGVSTLHLTAGPTGGHHHLAALIPSDAAEAGMQWLRGRVELLEADGDRIHLGPPEWDSASVYFRGPDGIILELIARHRLANPSAGPFDAGSLLSISEIGVPVADVAAVVDTLGREMQLPPFGEPGPDFAPVGDDDGLLIVVDNTRIWFPTLADRPATGSLSVTLDRAAEGVATTLRPAPGTTIRSC